MNKTKNIETGEPERRRSLNDVFWGETARDRRNNYRYAACALLWVVSMAGAAAVLKSTGIEGPLAWAVAAVPIALSFVVLASYLRFLRQADELVRKIQFEGIAFGFGVAAIVHFGASFLHMAGLPDLSRNALVTIMVLAYLLGTAIASWRYR